MFPDELIQLFVTTQYPVLKPPEPATTLLVLVGEAFNAAPVMIPSLLLNMTGPRITFGKIDTPFSCSCF